MSEKSFTILVDTREKEPYRFNTHKSVAQKLDTGDYTLVGWEDRVSIERKKSVSEIAGNVTQDRFWREMDRLQEFEHKILLLEFTEEEVMKYPKGAKIPKFLKKKIRVRGPFIMSCLKRIEDMGITIVWAGSRFKAQKWVEKFFLALEV